LVLQTPYFTQTQLTMSQQGRGLLSTTLFYLKLFVFCLRGQFSTIRRGSSQHFTFQP